MKKYMKAIGLFIVILIGIIVLSILTENDQVKRIRSERELHSFYKNNVYHEMSFIEKMLFLPFSIVIDSHPVVYDEWSDIRGDDVMINATRKSSDGEVKDYSKTNIQVDGVDEADIIKTDGNYIYSISKRDVVITNAEESDSISIESVIKSNDDSIPVDLMLYQDKLVVISSLGKDYYHQDTIIKVYDISNKKNPKSVKTVTLYEPYYTTRCIDNQLYVFSKGKLREENDKIVRDYMEDGKKYQIDFSDIQYLKDYSSNIQTLICTIDLDSINKMIQLDSYLMDISNAYVSKKAIYLLDEDYEDEITLSKLFGLKGVIGLFDEDDFYDDYTNIFKFRIDKNKGVVYSSKTKVLGKTINQYSLDENNNHLRVALESDEGTRIAIFDDKMKQIGESESVAKGERMYASRFMNHKAYLVTYQNTDPLFVIDLSDETNPTFMGELHIPGYSTYLHPYDDTHLIGIGVNTEEDITRDSSGKIISNWARQTGMKMSLFDVSDIHNPKEISKTTIGDRMTTSAILSNPKALLFSKEKNLLAIPVNHYDEDSIIIDSEEKEEEDVDLYTSEGYFVYHIDLENGFDLRGIISHDKSKSAYYYYNSSKLLRGLYIDNRLYTVSESAVKVHDLESLKEISSIKLEENGVGNYEK